MKTAPVGVPVGLVLGPLPPRLQEDLPHTDVDVIGREVEQELRDLRVGDLLDTLMLFSLVFLLTDIWIEEKRRVRSSLVYALQHPNRVVAPLLLEPKHLLLQHVLFEALHIDRSS